MKQYEAVIKVMAENGGYATFSYLYQHALNVPNVKWGTKTPHASIRRIVQNRPEFFKIKPGLWALNSYKDKLPFSEAVDKDATLEKQTEFNHSYYQGLLVEIGNFNQFNTFVPNQDKNRLFLDKPLSELASIHTFYQFSYPEIIKHAQTVDVTWFNQRKLPKAFIEIEHSTDIYRSLIKFVELQDFCAEFIITAPKTRQAEFEDKLKIRAFEAIKKRVKFWDYERVVAEHFHLTKLTIMKY